MLTDEIASKILGDIFITTNRLDNLTNQLIKTADIVQQASYEIKQNTDDAIIKINQAQNNISNPFKIKIFIRTDENNYGPPDVSNLLIVLGIGIGMGALLFLCIARFFMS